MHHVKRHYAVQLRYSCSTLTNTMSLLGEFSSSSGTKF